MPVNEDRPPDHAMAVAWIRALREELQRMAYKNPMGDFTLLTLFGKSLDQMEYDVAHHNQQAIRMLLDDLARPLTFLVTASGPVDVAGPLGV